ncbi:MAG: undecaprenyl-phosphate glucose phosphotransferase [Phycisphaerales bacterium]
MLRQRHRFFRSLLVACDTVVVAACLILAWWVRFFVIDGHLPPTNLVGVVTFSTHGIPFFTGGVIVLAAMAWSGLYRARRDQRFVREAGSLLRAAAVGTFVTFAFVSFFSRVLYEGRDPSRVQYLVWFGLLVVLLTAWRGSFRLMLRYLRRRGWNLRHVAIIGTGRLGQVVHRTLRRNTWTGINPTYFIAHHPRTSRDACGEVPVLGGLEDLERILDEHEVSGVFIALPGRMAAELPALLIRLARHPIDVRVVPDVNPRHMPMNMAVSDLEGMPVLSVRESPLGGWGGLLKRTVDLGVGALALAIFALPMAIIAGLVRASGPGPVIFRQERMSLNGQRFRIFKFRTMQHMDAEAQSLRDAGRGTAAWTSDGDPRITRIGRFLRHTSLDELPQLFNVLLGEMSLVGPRPERPELIAGFRDDWRGYMLRQNVKAGMTGWAQVNGLRGDTSLRKRLQYDLFYIRNWSIGFDLRILWMTLFRGFVHPNAN